MEFSIIVTSDLHGEYGRFQTIAQEVRDRKPDLLIDNGDFLQGSKLSYYIETVSKGTHPMISLANEIGYDVAVFGNHDFNYPLKEIESMREACNFPWISCNINNFAKPYFIKYINGLKVVVLGVTTHFTKMWDERNYLNNLEFDNALESVKKLVPYIHKHEQPDFLIVSYHGGFAKDPFGNWVFDQNTGENQALEMLEIEGIDLLITGHQHLLLQGKLFHTTYFQPGAHGYSFAHLNVTRKNNEWDIAVDLVPVEKEYALPVEVSNWLDTKIGYIKEDLTYENLLDVMLNGHSYIDFFHQFQLELTNAELSVTELFFNQSGGFKGAITNADVLTNYPRQNVLKVIKLSGEQIVSALEQSYAVFAINDDGKIDFAFNVYPSTLQQYLFDFWGGLDVEVDLHASVGERVISCLFKSEPIKLDKKYTIAINSYRALGIPPFTSFKEATVISESKLDIPKLIMDYIKEKYD